MCDACDQAKSSDNTSTLTDVTTWSTGGDTPIPFAYTPTGPTPLEHDEDCPVGASIREEQERIRAERAELARWRRFGWKAKVTRLGGNGSGVYLPKAIVEGLRISPKGDHIEFIPDGPRGGTFRIHRHPTGNG